MNTPKFSKNICILIICISSLSLFSQTEKDSIIVKEIETITVQGKKQKEEIVPFQIISGKDLENLNSFSVADAIRYFSGVQIKDYGGIGGMKTVNVRGMGSQYISVFYDGIQLGNAQNAVIDLGKYSLDNLEAISLYNGQRNKLLQTAKDYASAGSIYLVSKTPVFLSTKNTNISVKYRSGSFALSNPSILWEQKINNKLSTSFNVEYINSDGKYKYTKTDKDYNGNINWQTTGIRKNGNISALRTEAGLFGKLNKGKWNTKLYYYNSEKGIPAAVVKNVDYSQEKQWDKNFFIQSNFEKEITSNYKLLVNAKYANDYTRYRNITSSLQIDNTFNQNEFYISASQQYTILPFWEVALSTDYQYNNLDSNMYRFAQPKRNTELIALATSIYFRQFRIQANLLETLVQDKTRIGTSAKNKNELSPSVSINYNPFRVINLDIYAFYKELFRMPTFNDLYYTDIGSVNLKPEYASQHNIGIKYSKSFKNSLLRDFTLQADSYYNKITDKIVAINKNPYRSFMQNIGEVRIKGINTSAQIFLGLSPNLLLNLKANYTYEEALDYSDPSDVYYKEQIPNIPKHSGSLVLGIAYKQWSLNYNTIFIGEQYNLAPNIPDNYVEEIYLSDISLFKDFLYNSLNIKLGIEINNLFDKQYSLLRNYPMPGRNYRVTVKLNL